MEEPDPRTIRRAAAGDRDAFAEIVRATQPHVWRFIRHLVHDDDLAADLTQDTYLRVHGSLRSFRGDSLFRTWVFRIARNITIDDHRRSERRGPGVPLSEAPQVLLQTTDGSGLRWELQAALDSLPETQRSAFVLVEVVGLRYREAAEVLDVSEGTMKSRVFHARSKLVRWFGEGVDAEAEGGGDHG